MPPAALPTELRSRPFTTREALKLGVTPDRLRTRELWTPTRGVRSVDLSATLVDRARAFAAVAVDDFAFSHVTAAQLLGMPLSLAVEEDLRLHIMSRTPANRMRRFEVAGHRGLETRAVCQVHGLPVVAAADTWADLGEYVGRGKPVGLDDLIIAGDAVANLTGTVDSMKQVVEARVRPRGKVTLTFAIPRIRLGSASAMETRSRLMVVRAGLPEPALNQHVFSRSGDGLGCGDLVWLEQRVVGEFQGVEFHSRPKDQARDARRRQGMEADGDWTVVEIVAADIFDREARAAKLFELAGHLGANPRLLDVMAAEPQFHAPAQFTPPRRPRPQ